MSRTPAPIYIAPHVRANCSEPDHSEREWKAILTDQCFRCFYCSLPVTDLTVTKDHLHPICRGGCGCVGNLVGACLTCNSMKRELTVREFIHARPSFLRHIGEFSTRILLLSGQALFWYKLRPLIQQLAVQKRFPELPRFNPERVNAQKAKIGRRA